MSIESIDAQFARKKFGDYDYNFTQVNRSSWDAIKHDITSLEKQLAECRAVIAAKDDALRKIHNGAETRLHAQMIADEALAIKPGDVELVEFGELRNGLWVSGGFSSDMSFKLYHIKTKENKCTS